MRYFSINRNQRTAFYILLVTIFLTLAVSFIYIFIKINAKSLNIGISIIWWFLYIFILLFLSAFLFSILNSQNILLEKYIVISLGLLGFTRVNYNNIKSVSFLTDKKKLRAGIHIKNNICYMLLSKDGILVLRLKEPVKIYYFIFFKRYADTIIFSSSNSLNLKNKLENNF